MKKMTKRDELIISHMNKMFGCWALKEPPSLGYINEKILPFCVTLSLDVWNFPAHKELMQQFMQWSSMRGLFSVPKQEINGKKTWGGGGGEIW